jgi:hypothetical protein
MSYSEPNYDLWLAGWEHCRICGYEGVMVAPADIDLDNMECVNCGHMTCEIINE